MMLECGLAAQCQTIAWWSHASGRQCWQLNALQQHSSGSATHPSSSLLLPGDSILSINMLQLYALASCQLPLFSTHFQTLSFWQADILSSGHCMSIERRHRHLHRPQHKCASACMGDMLSSLRCWSVTLHSARKGHDSSNH